MNLCHRWIILTWLITLNQALRPGRPTERINKIETNKGQTNEIKTSKIKGETNKYNQITHNRSMAHRQAARQERPAPNRKNPKGAINRHLLANETNDKQRRTWGYRGQRVGEASNPGPWDLEQEYNRRRIQ